MKDYLPAAETLSEIAACRRSKRRILGVDGIEVVPNGYMGRLDLLLDLSNPTPSTEEAADQAEKFVKAHKATNIVLTLLLKRNDSDTFLIPLRNFGDGSVPPNYSTRSQNPEPPPQTQA